MISLSNYFWLCIKMVAIPDILKPYIFPTPWVKYESLHRNKITKKKLVIVQMFMDLTVGVSLSSKIILRACMLRNNYSFFLGNRWGILGLRSV